MDGYALDENVEMMRAIEARVFQVVKTEEFKGSWDGSLKSNEEADKHIASFIRNSFRVYEKNRRKDETYFTF